MKYQLDVEAAVIDATIPGYDANIGFLLIYYKMGNRSTYQGNRKTDCNVEREHLNFQQKRDDVYKGRTFNVRIRRTYRIEKFRIHSSYIAQTTTRQFNMKR